MTTNSTPFEDDMPELDSAGNALIEGEFEVDEFGEVMNSAPVEIDNPRIFLPQDCSQGDAIIHLSRDIPQNEYGLPLFFYRVDLLPYNLGQLTQNDADNCVVELEYADGYPTFNGGNLFWQQLPAEPMNDFLLFQRYVDQALELGLRQIQMLAMDQNISMEHVQELHKKYFWSARTRAYDLFQVAAERKRRELRARSIENNHYNIASDLIGKLTPFLEDPKTFEDLDARDKVEVLRQLINIQRVATGLPQNGNAGGVPINPDAAMSGSELMEAVNSNIKRAKEGGGVDSLTELMKDPAFVLAAQGIVLKVRHHNDPNAMKDVTPVE